MNKVIKILDGVGEVTFAKSKRAKNIRITIKPGGFVRVTVPQLVSMRKAEHFVMDKQHWIAKHIQEQKERENYTIFDDKTEFSTYKHALVITRNDTHQSKAQVMQGEILVSIPARVDIKSAEVQSFIRKSIEETLRIEAKLFLPKRTEQLAAEFGFSFNKVTIRNTKTRWGSCSYENNINYSLHLMRLPQELRDYVILHELAHTKEKNHQPPFWSLLDSVTDGRAKWLDKQLKNYSTIVY